MELCSEGRWLGFGQKLRVFHVGTTVVVSVLIRPWSPPPILSCLELSRSGPLIPKKTGEPEPSRLYTHFEKGQWEQADPASRHVLGVFSGGGGAAVPIREVAGALGLAGSSDLTSSEL